jgi:hypothetical protein
MTCSFYEGILYFIKSCAHRTFNKNLATKHYSQNRRFWGSGRGKIIPTISTVSFFMPTVKFPRLRCIQFVRSQSLIYFKSNKNAETLKRFTICFQTKIKNIYINLINENLVIESSLNS